MNLPVFDNQIQFSDRTITLPHTVKKAFLLKGKIVVLFDPDANLGKTEQFRNLVAISTVGVRLWEAELPTNMSSDVYYDVTPASPIIAYSFRSYTCTIDPDTGLIISKEFTK